MILIDTHVVVWLAFDHTRVSKNARRAIDDARQHGNGLAICDITLFELASLASKGRIRLEISLESFLREVEMRFVVLPITGEACVRALSLPATYPKDPADRIIGATAAVEGISLVTADAESIVRKRFTRSGEIPLNYSWCPSIWLCVFRRDSRRSFSLHRALAQLIA